MRNFLLAAAFFYGLLGVACYGIVATM